MDNSGILYVGRIPAYDIAKGIGILLVVLGHVTYNNVLSSWIYSFHMPLFFLMSGMLYHTKPKFLLSSFKRIMIPYFFFAILSFLYWYFLESNFRPTDDAMSPLVQLSNIIYPMNIDNGFVFNIVLWFLPCLFFTSIVAHYMNIFCRSKKMLFGVCFCCVIIYEFLPFDAPLMIPQVVCALPFYISGILLRSKMNGVENYIKKRKLIVIILCISMLGFAFLFSSENDMRSCMYKNGYMIFFMIAIMLVIATLFISVLIEKNKLLEWLGINSLVIMLIHEPLKRIIIVVVTILLHTETSIVRYDVFLSIVICLLTCLIMVPFVYIINRYAKIVFGKS